MPQTPAFRIKATALSVVLALAGCAQLPASEQASQMKAPDALRADRALAGPQADWPTDTWWTAYGDAQLNALIDEAFAGAPDLAVAAARLRQAEAVTEVTGAANKPQVNANVQITEQKLSYNYLYPKDYSPSGWTDYGTATLDFNWQLDFWGRNRAALASATSQLDAARAEQAQTRLTLAAGVASAYAELNRLFEARDVAKQSVEVRSKTAQLFAERFANGLETRGSVKEAETNRAVAEGNLLQIEEAIGLQRHRIAALIGAGPDRGEAIQQPHLKIDHGFGLPANLPANLIGRRPDIVAARLQAEAQSHRVDQKQADFYPNISLTAMFGWQAIGVDMLRRSGSDMGSIGPAISLPIFSGGRLRGELRNARAGYDEAVANYNATLTRALQDVADSALSQRALQARLDKANEAYQASTEAYRVARNRYEGGLATYLEVLSAENGMLNSLNALSELRARAFTLDIALKRALGGGYQASNDQT
ncbi:efflux transporter outer membrane subunit [Aquabacterium sp.]|uniref:efflux transporter outer membrane subunit n=1 Tax=Aquabacterium sp. TaxID=1872578 RepID=UPI0035B2FC4B